MNDHPLWPSARRISFAILGPAAIALSACAPNSSSHAASPAPPRHMLLITVDTLRADHLGAYGYERPTSPAIDALAQGSIVFEAAYSTSSWTLPAIASLLSGEDPFTHGCTGRGAPAPESLELLPERMAAAGFHTGAVTSHVFLHSRYALHQGFHDWDEELVQPSKKESHFAISSPEVTRRGLAFIAQREAARDGPWMLWLHYFDPHHKYHSHTGMDELFGADQPIDRYDGEIRFTDAHLGELLSGLEQAGFADETAVILIADHGEEFGEHGGTTHRRTLFQEVLRVPFLMRVPGAVPRRVNQAVSVLDVYPTLVELFELPAPRASPMQGPGPGRSLLPFLRGKQPGPRPLIASLRNGPADWDALVSGRWKIVRDNRLERVHLYDLKLDPGERRDLAGEHPDRVERMTDALDRAISRARRRGERLERPAELQLSPDQAATLEALGYGGEGPSGSK